MAAAFNYEQELATLLIGFYGTGVIKIDTEKGFELAAHRRDPTLPRSPTYFNLRTTTHPTKPGRLTPSEVNVIARLMYERLTQTKIEFDGLCGVPDAGVPFARALQEHYYNLDRRDVPLLTLKKGNGLKKTQGLPRGSRVLLIDDVVSDAGSKVREGIEPLRLERYIVRDCIVCIDREQGGAAQLERPSVKVGLCSIVSASEVFDLYERARIILPEVREKLRHYHATSCAA